MIIKKKIASILPVALGPGVYSEMSTGNIKEKMFLGNKVRLVRVADNLTAIYEPIV
jgi:hypothetical protein